MKSSLRTFSSRLFPVILLFLLLLYPSRSIQGAADGLVLWFTIVLPTLSPFIICTQMVVLLGGMNLLVRPFYPAVHKVFGLSASGTYVLICGLLCGYPLGAKLCSDFLRQNRISRQEANYLLSICNHPSPMFLLGFVKSQLTVTIPSLFLLMSLYLPILPVSMLSRRYYRRHTQAQQPDLAVCEVPAVSFSMETILMSTAETMVIIGGYIMLFSILTVWIQQIPFLSPATAACLSGVAEITTGVYQITTRLPPSHALFAVVAIVAFGGFSGIFQTKSVIKNAGLSIRHYLLWKLVHMTFACLVLTLLMPSLLR